MKSFSLLKTSLFLALLSPMVITSCSKSTKTDDATTSTNIEFNLGIRNGTTDITTQTQSVKELDLCAWTVSGDPVTLRSMLRFAQLPSTGGKETAPTKAYLTLYSHPKPANGDQTNANYGTNNSFTIRRVSSYWDPSGIPTWAAQPTTTTVGQVVVPHTDLGQLDLISIDVTQIVKDIYANGNNGILLQLRDETYYSSRIFCSTAHADANKRPKLTLVF
jgi:hypothetical protein